MRIAVSVRLSCLLFLAGSLFCSSVTEAQVDLRYRHTPGETQYYELKQTLTTTAKMAGQPPMENTISQQLQLSSCVNKVEEDGSAKVCKRIHRIMMQASQPGLETPLEYDSQSEKELPGAFRMIASSLSKLVNQDLMMQVSCYGETLDVELPQSIKDQIEASGGGLAGVNSAEGVKKMLSQGIVFPDHPVSVNDQWTRELMTDLPFGVMISKVQLTYAGVTKEGLHRINAVSHISLVPKPEVPFQINVKGADGRGVYLFDANRGCIYASALNQKLHLEISAAGQTIDQNVVTDVTMKLIEPASRTSSEPAGSN